ncbi:MAG: TrmB family transcriptional regulator [Thaumarchaeota archaeon]|nr:TrmB family transcriptional regulator [Nitrososphaerota archaeon]
MGTRKKSSKSLFIETSDSVTNYNETFEKLINILTEFGLSEYEAKIFIYLGKYGTKTAPEIKNSLEIPRSETYGILTRLQNKSLIIASFEQPMTYSILSPEKTIETILEQEMQRISHLKILKKELLELWDTIPNLISDKGKEKGNRFQILQGINQTNGKIKEIISYSKKEICIIGSQKDFLRFYNADIIDSMKKSKADVKILCSDLEKITKYFKGIDKKSIKSILEETRKHQCFVIIDGSEVLFFMKETDVKEKMLATWTDSDSLIRSLVLLFDLIWTRDEEISNKEKKRKFLKLEQDAEFRLKELKQEMKFTEAFNKLIKKKTLKSKK